MKSPRGVFLSLSAVLVYCLFTKVSGNIVSLILGDGKNDISGDISGIYQHLDFQSLTTEANQEQKCAASLDLDASRDFNQFYTLKLPKSLSDPSGVCRPHPDFKGKEVKLVDYGKTLSILSKFTKSEDDDISKKVYMMATIPRDALMCPAGSPFETLILASMKDTLTAVLRAHLKEIGISPSVLAKIFQPPTKETVWGAPIMRSMNRELQEALAKFKDTYVMLLVHGFSTSQVMAETTTFIDVSSRRLMGIAETTCSYLRGPITFAQVVKIVYEVTDILRPLLSSPVYTPIKAPTRQFFTASQGCSVFPSDISALQMISFSETPSEDLVPGQYGMGTEVSVSVNGNDNCATIVMRRLLEAEGTMGETNYGLHSLDRVKKLINQIDNRSEGSTRLYLGGILENIFNAQAKSIIYVAALDIQKCSGFPNAPPMTMIYVKKSTKAFLCSSQNADKPGCLLSQKGSIPLGATDEEGEDAATIFLANASVEEECILSTSTLYEGTLKSSLVTKEPVVGTPEPISAALSLIEMTPNPVAV